VSGRQPAPPPAEKPDPSADASQGIVYSCAGERYVEEALRSARSSLRHNDLPHVLFTTADAECEPGMSVVRFEPSENAYADKIANMRRSPFQRTIYLDTDTFVVDEIVHLLALLDHFDLAVAHDPSRRGGGDREVPVAFCEFNTGVIAWRASDRMEAFMRGWQETYLAWLADEPFAGAAKASARRRARLVPGVSPSWGGAADQPAFRRCAWEHDVRLLVLPPEYNLRLGEPATVVDPVRVIHGRHSDYESLARRINETQGPRRWPRPAPLRARLRRAGRARRSAQGS
jgi:hypothetical protein